MRVSFKPILYAQKVNKLYRRPQKILFNKLAGKSPYFRIKLDRVHKFFKPAKMTFGRNRSRQKTQHVFYAYIQYLKCFAPFSRVLQMSEFTASSETANGKETAGGEKERNFTKENIDADAEM